MITRNDQPSDRTAFLFPRRDVEYQLILVEAGQDTALARAQNLADQLQMPITVYTYREDNAWGMQCWEVTPELASDLAKLANVLPRLTQCEFGDHNWEERTINGQKHITCKVCKVHLAAPR